MEMYHFIEIPNGLSTVKVCLLMKGIKDKLIFRFILKEVRKLKSVKITQLLSITKMVIHR
jgi:hypothetical protein